MCRFFRILREMKIRLHVKAKKIMRRGQVYSFYLTFQLSDYQSLSECLQYMMNHAYPWHLHIVMSPILAF